MATFNRTRGTTWKRNGTFKSTGRGGYSYDYIQETQQKNKSAYDTINDYYTRIGKGEYLSTDDRTKYKSAIDTFTSTGNYLRDLSRKTGAKYTDDEERGWQESIDSLNQGYTDIDKFYNQFADEKQYGSWKAYEEQRKGYESVKSAEDYAEYSKGNFRPDVKIVLEDMLAIQNAQYKIPGNVAEYGDHAELRSLRDKYMTDDEWGIFNYYVNKGDPEKAEEYLAWNDENLKQRYASDVAGKFNNTPLELVFSIGAGLEQAFSGLRNFGKGVYGDNPIDTPKLLYAAGQMGADNEGLWKVANDFTQTVANQLPSIATSYASGSPTLGAIQMGLSAAGNSYADMINKGYSKNQARAYGVMIGASEFALNKVLGGISALGGGSSGIFQSISTKVLPKIDNAVAKVAIKLGGNMLDEGLEEGVQTALEPVFEWAATLGEAELERVNWEEIGYSALLGSLSAGLLEGVPSVADGVSVNQAAQNAYANQAPDIVAQALELNPDNKAAQMAQKQLDKGKGLSGLTLNELVQNNDTALIKNAVENRLLELGESGDISALANALAKRTVGKDLSLKEKNIIKNSKFGERISNELNADNIRSGQYTTAWAEGIGTRRANADVYNIRKRTDTPANQNATQEAQAASETAQSTPRMTESAQLVEDAAKDKMSRLKGFTKEAANVMTKGYDGQVSASEYIRTFDEAYKLGLNGAEATSVVNLAHNTEGVNQSTLLAAYDLGRQAKEKSVLETTPTESDIINTESEALTNEGTSEGAGVHLRRGSERNDGSYPEEQVQGLESRPGTNRTRGEGSRPSDGEAANLVNEGREVRVAELGILNGSKTQTVRLVDANKETKLMKKARKDAESRGLKIKFFVGDNIAITEKTGEISAVRAYVLGDTMLVRADHPVYTADQLERHEAGHVRIERGEINQKDVRKRLEEIVGKEAVEGVAEAYAELYAGTGMTADEIWEECICDFLGDINIFSKSANGSLVVNELINQTQAITKEQKAEPNQTRGSPETEGKASRETAQKIKLTSTNQKNTQVSDVRYDGIEKFSSPKNISWINVAYDDFETKEKITSELHQKMIDDGLIVKISDEITSKVKESYPNLQGMKKKERLPILKESIKQLKSDLRTFLSQFKGNSFEFEVQGNVLEAKLYNAGIDEVLEKVTQDKAEMLYTTEEIFKNSKYLYSTPDYDGDPNIYRWNYFYTPVQISDNAVGVRIAIRDMINPHESQVYNWGIKKDTSLDGTGRGANDRSSYGVSSDVSSDNSIPQKTDLSTQNSKIVPEGKASRELDTEYLSAVERGDMKAAQRMVDEAAKNWGAITNDKGKVMKFYHGTEADFNVFSYESVGKATGVGILGDGFYFTDKKRLAKDYGQNIRSFYLQMSNPYSATENDFYRLHSDKLSEAGYDGVVFKAPSGNITMVLDNTQMKLTDSVTYDDDGNVIPLSERFNSESNDIRYSRELDVLDYITPEEEFEAVETQAFSNRTILANALLDTITSSEEYKLIRSYQEEIAQLDASDRKLAQLKKDLNQLYKQENPNFEVIRELNEKIKTLEGEIVKRDKRLLRLESTTALKNVLERAKKDAYAKAMQKGKETMHRAVEGRHKTIERNKIKNIAHELDTLLNKGNKKRNVKIGAQGVVRAALDLSDMYLISDEELIMNGIETPALDRESAAMEKYRALYEKLHSTDDDVTNHKEERAQLRHEMNELKKNLAELLERERRRINDTKASSVYDALIKEYEKLANSPSTHISQAFDEDALSYIKTLKAKLGNKLVSEMTLEDLQNVHKVFTMVKTMVSNSNKLFKMEENATVEQYGAASLREIEAKGHKKQFTALGRSVSALAWNNLKPVYLMERTGSETLEGLFQSILDGEGVWAKDMEHAQDYIRRQKAEYKFDSWDFETTHEFKTPSGKTFKLNLEQMMTIYAYSKRGDQALEHLRTDGFVFDKVIEKKKGIEYELNDKTAYKITDETRIKIIGKLTQDQRAYADAMQEYLSKTMGAKGNEVSVAMYGIELYGDKNYLPIHSEGAYLERAREQAKGDVKLKNKGFTKTTIKHARNAIVLSEFDKLCAEHIAEMSSYHAFALALEDFYKVYNYQTRSEQVISAQTPLIDLTDDNELSKAVEGVYGAQRYKIIANYIMSVLGNQQITLSDGTSAIIDKRDSLHIANRSGNDKTRQIAKIKDLISQSTLYAEDIQAEHNKFNEFLYYKATVRYGAEEFPLYLNVGKGINDGKYHIYDITKKIRDTAGRINGLERPKPNEGYALENGISNSSISQNSEFVNTQEIRGVIPALENAYGKGATGAIDQLLTDLNGGARSDPRETLSKRAIALHKKAKVMASLSVVIQQPSSILRAQAMVDPKYFIGERIGEGKHKELWAEMKKYAPVTIIKEMGYFDVGMGKSSAEWLLDDSSAMDKIDEITSKPASFADEITWVAIWNAVKRETANKNPSLNTSSKEFLEKAGSRFEDVIRHTQVYDSTLARSGNMRSKSAFMQMATSFMAEPTTSINMREMAARSGDKKRILRTTAAVYSSVLLNALLVALPYAMRDDDEDETFLEKYTAAFTDSFISGVNPVTSLPFVKDIWSIFQGYDVERADMSLASDLIESLKKLAKAIYKNEGYSETIVSILGDLSAFTGIPLDNIIRDAKSVINAGKTIMADKERDTTWNSILDQMEEVLKSNTPVWGWLPSETKSEKLYEAVIAGDEKYVERFKASYSDEKAYKSALRKAIRDNDERVERAALAKLEGDIDTYWELMMDVVDEGHFDMELIKDAFAAEYNYHLNKKREAEEIGEDYP